VKQFLGEICSNYSVAEGYNLLEFTWPSEVVAPVPGQFVTIRNNTSTDPLLRRPFAVAGFTPGICQIVFQIRGKGTHALAACRKGDRIDVLGPLGVGFPAPQLGRTPYLLAGGIGFGPVYYFANTLSAQGGRPVVIIGARTAALFPKMAYDKLNDGNDEFHFCTDDGSEGFHGTVIDTLSGLRDLSPNPGEIFACGPKPMLSACATYAEEADIPCWVSMEQVMGCGVGACMGCAIRSSEPGKYVRVCTEGPVFNARDLRW
jgi:dihydroorotate dehydrogenase electron transfer subunit